MAYRFKSSDTGMTDAVRRIAASEFDLVRHCLADRSLPAQRKVHEARKATKRLRALLRLVAPVCPQAGDEITALREAAARLSALRDKGALTESLMRLELADTTATALKDAFAARSAPGAAAQKKLLAGFAAEMEMAAGRAATWTLSHDGWAALAPGLERSHRRFRKTVDAARRAVDEEPVHEFRKRAKDHWYHTLLLRGAFPHVMDGYAAAAESLCDDLGDWRDLGLLGVAVAEVPAHLLAKADAAAALALIERSRRRALKRAFRTARGLTNETPEVYAGRLKTWWKTTR
jgi:CHAD domain-containing protein